jgi:hypothetical protein
LRQDGLKFGWFFETRWFKVRLVYEKRWFEVRLVCETRWFEVWLVYETRWFERSREGKGENMAPEWLTEGV